MLSWVELPAAGVELLIAARRPVAIRVAIDNKVQVIEAKSIGWAFLAEQVQLNVRLKPELCLAIRALYMYMHSRLFAGEEVKPETGFPEDGRPHTFNCSVESQRELQSRSRAGQWRVP